MYIDIQNKVDEVKKSLITELRQSKAIDSTGKVINTETFKNIVKSTIQKLDKIESLVTNENGVITNKYGANIVFKAQSEMNDMLEYKSLNPEKDRMTDVRDIADELADHTSIFHRAIKKIFGKKSHQYQKPEISR